MKVKRFLEELRTEAAIQAKLEHTRFLPKELDLITSFIAVHAFWVLVVLSACSAVLVEFSQWRWM